MYKILTLKKTIFDPFFVEVLTPQKVTTSTLSTPLFLDPLPLQKMGGVEMTDPLWT